MKRMPDLIFVRFTPTPTPSPQHLALLNLFTWNQDMKSFVDWILKFLWYAEEQKWDVFISVFLKFMKPSRALWAPEHTILSVSPISCFRGINFSLHDLSWVPWKASEEFFSRGAPCTNLHFKVQYKKWISVKRNGNSGDSDSGDYSLDEK